MESVTGIVLAGGKSSRFKSASPKYLAKLGERALVEIITNKLKHFCEEIIVVGKEPVKMVRGQRPEVRTTRNQNKILINVIEKDKHFHPLTGIKAGLEASSNDANIVHAVDMPFVSSETIKGLLKCKADACVYRYKGKIEPLLGFYHKKCLTKIADSEDTRIIETLDKCKCDYLEVNQDCLDFFNINTTEDLDEARQLVENNPQLLSI